MPKTLSVIVTVYQKEHQIGTVVRGIIDNTTTPFQLVMVYDGCTDKSEEVVNRELERYGGMMRDFKVIHTPDVNEVRANNAGMRAADGDHLVLVQDDMWIVERGWEKRLVLPLETWDDVFAVGARNAHSFVCGRSPGSVSYSCTMEAGRDLFRIRDGINRGPIAFEAQTLKLLDFIDDIYAPLYFDEMDLCVRAYRQLGKVCGVYGICWRNLRGTVHVAPDEDIELSTGGSFTEASRKNQMTFWERYHEYLEATAGHDEDRALIFEPDDRLEGTLRLLRVNDGADGHSVDPATLHAKLGKELLRNGHRRAAFRAFSNSLEFEPGNIAALTGQGMLHWGNEDSGDAIKCLTSALRMKPHARRPLLELVRIFTALNKTEAAGRLLETYMAYDPCDREIADLRRNLSAAADAGMDRFACGGRG